MRPEFREFEQNLRRELREAYDPATTLDVLDQGFTELLKLATDDNSDDMQRVGAFFYEEIYQVRESLMVMEKGDPALEPLCDKLISLTKRLLIKVFQTTEEQIAVGLEEYRNEVTNA